MSNILLRRREQTIGQTYCYTGDEKLAIGPEKGLPS